MNSMKLLLQSNDPTLIPFIEALLRGHNVDCFVLDTHMSVLEGSIGIFPRRVMVLDCDYECARQILIANNVELSDG